MATASVIVLRRKRPELPRPYKTLGYPVVPVLFVIVAGALIFSTLVNSPRESVLGLGIIAVGIPFYLRWRRNAND
jgi:basic amino acid/polyamine antiporter, APA family